jgi:hypothetical protein
MESKTLEKWVEGLIKEDDPHREGLTPGGH